MVTVVERKLAHFERRVEPYGEAYVWCPECVVVECGCGERLVLAASRTACRCGADHSGLVARESASRRGSRGASRPWRDEHPEWWGRQDDYLRSESDYRRELEAVEQLEEGDVGAPRPPSEGQGFSHYLITRREPSGFEAPHAFFRHGEGVIAVFCSEGAAKRYLASLAPEGGWHVSMFSAGELVSLLFALDGRVAWVLPDPLPDPSPGLSPARDCRPSPVGRDDFIAQLVRR